MNNSPHPANEYLSLLFKEGEVFEVRAISRKGEPPLQRWLTMGKDSHKLVDNILQVCYANERDLYVGVCPRTKIGSSVPSLGRVVWVDCDGVTQDEVKQSLWDLKLPGASMVVESGSGVHVYWLLDRDYTTDEIHKVTRWLSHNVKGGDGVAHDPTRILRVPGTRNWKYFDGSMCQLAYVNSGAVYELSDFPTEENHHALERPDSDVPFVGALSSDARAEIASQWVEGNRHHLALNVAGYLRKNLGYDAQATQDTLLSIHLERGGELGDENCWDIQNIVKSTYKRPLALVSGYQGLSDMGITLPGDTFRVEFPQVAAKPPRKTRMGLIDFSEELREQEFWVPGFIGPGLLTMIAAQPKTGKSLVAMQIGHALANGLNVYDFEPTGARKRVLYFQGELSRGMVYQRAKAMFLPGTYEDGHWLGMTDKPSSVLNIVSDPEPLYDLAEHYDVVIIDPLSAFNANDENSVTSTRETLAVFDTLKARGKAVVLIHHTKKLERTREGGVVIPSVSDIRGSSAWFAAVDALAMLYNVGTEGNAEMKFVYRAAPERKPLRLYRLEHGGFTHDRDAYLKYLSHRGMTVPLERQSLN